jgi:hypothetical protein
MYTGDAQGPIYTYSFSATSLSSGGPNDVFCVTAPSNSRLLVRELILGQTSDFGDAQAEVLSVTMLAKSTAIGGGSVITAVNKHLYTTAGVAAGSSVTGPSTTLASTASAVLFRADTWNVAAGYRYYPVPDERPVIGLSQRFVVRISTPNDGLTANGTLVLQQIGQGIGA